MLSCPIAISLSKSHGLDSRGSFDNDAVRDGGVATLGDSPGREQDRYQEDVRRAPLFVSTAYIADCPIGRAQLPYLLVVIPLPIVKSTYLNSNMPNMDDNMADSDNSDLPLDSLELAAAGYKQEMPRQFSFWSLAALAFDLTCTWLGVGSSLGISLSEASSAGTLWSIIVAGCMTMVVAAGMAELASAYPVAGAQYYVSLSASP